MTQAPNGERRPLSAAEAKALLHSALASLDAAGVPVRLADGKRLTLIAVKREEESQ